MRKRLWALQAVMLASVMAGCNLNLSDVNFSNIGNGNNVDAKLGADVKVGGPYPYPSTSPSSYYNPGPSPSSYYPYPGPTSTSDYNDPVSVSLNRSTYRVRLGFDPRTASPSVFHPSADGYPEGVPIPDLQALDEATVMVYASYRWGANYNVTPESSEWKWTIPAGLELAPYPYHQSGFMLVTKPDAVPGSYALKVESTKDPNLVATATIEVLDFGSVDVVIE